MLPVSQTALQNLTSNRIFSETIEKYPVWEWGGGDIFMYSMSLLTDHEIYNYTAKHVSKLLYLKCI